MRSPGLAHLLSIAHAVAWLGCAQGSAAPRLAACPADESSRPSAQIPAGAGVFGRDADAGAGLFQLYCARCHAPELERRGSRFFRAYPRLDCAEFLERATDGYLYTIIASGGPSVGRSSAMPAFGEALSDREITALIAHLRSTAGTAPP